MPSTLDRVSRPHLTGLLPRRRSCLLGSQTAGGVTAFKYKSDRDIKRRAELLGMRTIFLDWWGKEWVRLGGDYQEDVAQLVRYPFRPPT
jgi:hypothetical protein